MKFDLDKIKLTPKATIALAIISVVIFITAIFISKNWDSSQIITKVQVRDTKYIENNEIKSIAEQMIGTRKDSIDLFLIENQILKHPYVDNCVAKFSPTSDLIIEIQEKIPVAFCSFGNGNISVLDSKGDMLPYELYRGFQFLPVVTGMNSETPVKIRLDAAKITHALNSENNKSIYAEISEINFDKEIEGFKFILANSETQLIIGKSNKIQRKIDEYKILSKNKFFRKEFPVLQYIDLRWDKKIIVKKV